MNGGVEVQIESGVCFRRRWMRRTSRSLAKVARRDRLADRSVGQSVVETVTILTVVETRSSIVTQLEAFWWVSRERWLAQYGEI